jgi:hypothetical protein
LILVLCGILILPFLFFEQGSENQAVKRRQTRFRTPIRNGGAARMKNFKFASCSCSNPSTTQESARRSVGKVVRWLSAISTSTQDTRQFQSPPLIIFLWILKFRRQDSYWRLHHISCFGEVYVRFAETYIHNR